MKVKKHYLPGVYFLDIDTESRIWPATQNYTPGVTVYNERLYSINQNEFRTWDPYKSKLAACIFKKMKGIPDFTQLNRILYLGSATGTTISHLSDIVADTGGHILALEFSARVARRLIQLSQSRPNIIPIVADARYPGEFASFVWSVDFIFQDISQINQAQIFIDNTKAFLKPGGSGILIIKAASIDSSQTADIVTQDQIAKVKNAGLVVKEVLDISDFEKQHRALLISN